jgi:hypothetical protein
MNDGIKDSLTKVTHGRPPGEVEWYSPARDISVLVPALISEALQGWDNGENDGYLNVLNRLGRKESDIGRVAESLAIYISEDSIVNTSSHDEALRKSGLLDIPEEIRMPVLATIGEEIICALWYAVRSATTTVGDDGAFKITQYNPKVVAEVARKATKLLRTPKWRRGITLKWWAIKAKILGGVREKMFKPGEEE